MEWNAYPKKGFQLELPQSGRFVVRTSCTKPVKISGVSRETGEITPISCQPFNHTVTGKCGEFKMLFVEGEAEFGAQYNIHHFIEEEHDPLMEVPERNPAMNILAKLRETARREMGITREMFENDTLFPGYENDTDLFEEEEFELAQQEEREANAATEQPPKEPANDEENN